VITWHATEPQGCDHSHQFIFKIAPPLGQNCVLQPVYCLSILLFTFVTSRMDPLTVLSLASNVVQFIDFAAKLVTRISEIYDDAQPSIKDYLHLASEIDRSPEIGIFRRFGKMNNLSLLYMQAEIASLEREFLTQHEVDGCSPCETTKSYNFSMDRLRCSNGQGSEKQRDLLLTIQWKLKIYSKSLIQLRGNSKL
jgi:hypothetical protein